MKRTRRNLNIAAAVIGMLCASTFLPVISTPATAKDPAAGNAVEEATARLVFAEPISRKAIPALTQQASEDTPVIVTLRTDQWTGWIMTSEPTSRAMSSFLDSSRAASGARPVVAIQGSAGQMAAIAEQYGGAVDSDNVETNAAAAQQSYTFDPATIGCREAVAGDSDQPVFPEGWTANVPISGTLTQTRLQGVVEVTSHVFRGVGNNDGQWPCTRRLVDGTQGQGFVLTSALAYEHDYKVDACNGYVGSNTSTAETNIPLSYLDTRASDAGCDGLDFTVGTPAPFLMDKGTNYEIETQGDAGAGARSSRARLTGEVLNVDGVGCQLNESPRGVIQASGNPWCVNVSPPFRPRQATSFISLPPGFIVRESGTCYNWVRSAGYQWCGPGTDPN